MKMIDDTVADQWSLTNSAGTIKVHLHRPPWHADRDLMASGFQTVRFELMLPMTVGAVTQINTSAVLVETKKF